ncbi:hypothetical protein ACH9DO_15525 [Kocuria sp. M1N1S27]|uniref:hypothetical protein n=1 Tax=Kocuria kalidii TaxID=3376283 RepID=UPI0037979E4D
MNTNKRVMAASAAAILGLLVAGCDNTETEAPADAPAEDVPENDFEESEMGSDVGGVDDEAEDAEDS